MTSGACVLRTIISACCWGETSSVLRLLNPPERAFSLRSMQTHALKLQYMMFLRFQILFLLISGAQAAMCSVHLEAVDGLLKTHLNWNKKIKLCAEHQCLLCWASLLEWSVRHYRMKAEHFCKTNGVKCILKKYKSVFMLQGFCSDANQLQP